MSSGLVGRGAFERVETAVPSELARVVNRLTSGYSQVSFSLSGI
jgi:hypothetical protein